MFAKLFGSGSGLERQGEMPLVEKNVTQSEKGVLEYQLSGNGGPLYFAPLKEEDMISPDPSVINEAKNKLQELHTQFPEEIKALNGAPNDVAVIKLAELQNRIGATAKPQYQEAA